MPNLVTKKFNIAKHTYPMYSLNNTYTENEVTDWEKLSFDFDF